MQLEVSEALPIAFTRSRKALTACSYPCGMQ